MDWKSLVLYFVLGGAVVTGITYFGSRGQGFLAALVAFVPSTTLLTLVTVYYSGGKAAALDYFRNMLYLIPAWALYSGVVVYFLPRLGLPRTIVASLAVFGVATLITKRLI